MFYLYEPAPMTAKPAPAFSRRLQKIARILRLKPFYQEQRAAAFEDRWEMIERRLEPEDRSLLDIGCNIGQFTARAAARGMLAIGIDAYEEVVARARRLHRNEPNLGFIWSDFGPETVHLLPRADIVLCLSVHHYWSRVHGEDASWGMIGEMARKAGKLFFEPASSHARYGRHSPDFVEHDPESLDSYVRRRFAQAVGASRTVERLGLTASIRQESFRPLYLIA